MIELTDLQLIGLLGSIACAFTLAGAAMGYFTAVSEKTDNRRTKKESK